MCGSLATMFNANPHNSLDRKWLKILWLEIVVFKDLMRKLATFKGFRVLWKVFMKFEGCQGILGSARTFSVLLMPSTILGSDIHYICVHSKTSQTSLTDHVHRWTTPLYRSLYLGPNRSILSIFKLPKPTTSLNGPLKVGPIVGQFREVLLCIYIYIW